jgi:hypothetical protein
MRREFVPPQIEGPLLEELFIGKEGVFPLTFATEKTFTTFVFIFLGFVIVETPGPLLPAEKTTAIPAASQASKIFL